MSGENQVKLVPVLRSWVSQETVLGLVIEERVPETESVMKA